MSDHHQDRTNQILVQQHAELMNFLREHAAPRLTPCQQSALDAILERTSGTVDRLNALRLPDRTV